MALESKSTVFPGESSRNSESQFDSLDHARLLAARLNGSAPFTLVIEDFHWAHESDVQRGLIELLELAPDLNIIIAARSPLEIESNYSTYATDVHVIGHKSLQFTDAESALFHAGTALEPVSDRLNERLHHSPVLHKAARLAATEAPRNTVDLVEDIVLIITASLHEQVNAQLIHPRDSALRGFMAATVELKYFDVELAQAVVPDCPNPEAMIRQLVEDGALRSSPRNGSVRNSYPGIVSEILTAALSAEIAACREHTLTVAASMEIERGDYLPAFTYSVSKGDYRLASNIILNSGLDLPAEEPDWFTAALETIPYTQIIKYPLLSLSLGLLYNGNKSTRFKGAEYFTLALAASKGLGHNVPAHERMALNTAQIVALRLTGQFKLSAATARNSLKDRSELLLENRDQLAAFESAVLAQWAISLIHVGDFITATTALHQSVSTGQAAGARQSVFFATSLLAYRYAIDGDLATAAEFADSAQRDYVNSPGTAPYQQTPLQMTLAMIEMGNLQADKASEHLRQVISETATSEFWGRIRVIEAQIDLLRGYSGIATARLDLVMAKTEELPTLNPIDVAGLTMVRSALLLARGNATGAAAILGKASSKKTPHRIARARLSLSLNQSAEVVEILSAVTRPETSLEGLHILVLRTVARLHLQDAESLRADLEKISGAIVSLKNQWPLALLPKTELELLRSAWRELGIPEPETQLPSEAPIPDALSRITLPPREASILKTLAAVSDRAEMARLHVVSLDTIKSQLRSLYKKLDVGTREDALIVAHREHLL
ncbi:hypothetical protein CVS30_03685 [Arthrobacter psychrolactophilus]|uniref:HTH luxR-type domain-containing protein n=1 Tax=Arthrobacter psychrolactophilus TaxID=92442 RepID=A0A2V5ITD6_9MICC|nr:hypothetical protein CVS30_03685 [Arthrobacter psychrolactophilus]